MVALTIITIIIAAVLFDLVSTRCLKLLAARRRKLEMKVSVGNQATFMKSTIAAKISQGVFHNRGHMWFQWKNDGSVTAGMNDLLHHIVGRIDEIKPPEVGQRLNRGGKAVLVRQGDRVLYLLSPVSGVVTKSNGALAAAPGLSKSDPYGAGWMFEMRPTEADYDMPYQMIMRRAEDWSRREIERMRTFFAEIFKKGAFIKEGESPLEMEGIAERMDETVWVLFKDQFVYQQEWRS